jgi:hypothetical protein
VPPRVVPATAPAWQLSAERAMAGTEAIAAQPHPAGSAANAAVRQHLLDSLTPLGPHPAVQTTTGITVTVGSPGSLTIALEDDSAGPPAIPGMIVVPRSVDAMPVIGPKLADPVAVRRAVTIPPADR